MLLILTENHTMRPAPEPLDREGPLATIPGQIERGFGTICIKPSQFTDDSAEIGSFCTEVMSKVAGY